MSNRKILIVTYYWPPSGGSGVQRWLKFVKYLTRMGWEPIVYTPENPSFAIQDVSLLKDVPPSVEVIKLPIWEPYQLFFKLRKLLGMKATEQTDFITTGKKNTMQQIAAWVRGNLLIPDARRFWIKPSVSFLSDFLQANQINMIITTGPPHSMHLIGLKLKKKFPSLKWIADFRDPWSDWDLLNTLSLSSWARRAHEKLERTVLRNATRVITIAPHHVERLQALGDRDVDLITNGFDEEDFADLHHMSNSKFTIRHIGIVDELRDPRPFMNALKKIIQTQPEVGKSIAVEFIGNVNSAFREFVKQDSTLNELTTFIGHVPHSRILELYGKTDLQLLVLAHTAIAPGNLPGKIFEYLASGNPILAIGPVDGDADRVLRETNSGLLVERTDNRGLETALINYFDSWKRTEPHTGRDVSMYSRENLTKKLIILIESMT